MLTILSPAKTLNFDKQELLTEYTLPILLEDSSHLVMELKKYSAKKLAALMQINPKLAQLNFERYQEWTPQFNTLIAKQAILSFRGDVYHGLGAQSFSQEDFEFAQHNLTILSGLYGVLRPLDLMKAYRLEMGTNLKTRKRKNLYDFWGDKITTVLNDMLNEEELINLASNEYFKVINQNLLKGKVITPVFKENRNGTYKFVHIFGKKARGLMARFIIQNRITDPEQIKLFDLEGYYYNDRLSKDPEWVFTRG